MQARQTFPSRKHDTNTLMSLKDVKKSFGTFQVLKDISLGIRQGEIHCLLGENGAGKSTLCNIIFGSLAPTEGNILLNGIPFKIKNPKDALNQGIAMVHQHFSLIENTTVLDNLLLGRTTGILNRQQQKQHIEQLLAELNFSIDLDRQISDLSVGEKQRVEIIKCLVRNPKLLILDEPTAVLLPNEIEALLTICETVAARGCSILLVTHKLAEIKKVASCVSVIRAGMIVDYSETPAQDIDRLVRSMINNTEVENSIIPPAAPITHAAQHNPSPNARPITDEILQINGLSYTDSQGITKLDNVTLIVNKGEIVAIAGVEGNGQSELAAILAGMLPATKGSFIFNRIDCTHTSPKQLTKLGMGVIPEDRHDAGCITQMSLAENILLNHLDDYTKFGFLNRTKLKSDAEKLIKEFDVRASSPLIEFGRLSGGNQQKAVFARELSLNPLKFLLASQPTRGLDVGAVATIYGYIKKARDSGLGVLLISSELDELINVADRIVVFYRGKIIGEVNRSQANKEQIGAWMAGQLNDK